MVQQIIDEYHSLLGFKNYILNFFRQNEMNNGHAKWSLALKGSKGLEDRSGTRPPPPPTPLSYSPTAPA